MVALSSCAIDISYCATNAGMGYLLTILSRKYWNDQTVEAIDGEGVGEFPLLETFKYSNPLIQLHRFQARY